MLVHTNTAQIMVVTNVLTPSSLISCRILCISGAFGYFEVTSNEITKYCKAKLFSQVGKRTSVAVRFSTVGKCMLK